MPIPTRSGHSKPAVPSLDRPASKLTYKSQIKASPTNATESLGDISQSAGDEKVSKLRPPKASSNAVPDKSRISKIAQPKPTSYATPAAQQLKASEGAQAKREALNASEDPGVSSSSAPSRILPPSSNAGARTTANLGHSRQQSAVIPKPKHIPAGHKRAISTVTPQLFKTGNAEGTRLRPDFNNFQQHFSPKKTPADASTGPGLKPRNVENASAHLQRSMLEDELLQLQLVHKESDKTLRMFRDSAERQLDTMRQTVLVMQDEVVRLESQYQRQLSLQALDEWLKTPSELSEEQKIQRLSGAVDELAGLGNSLWRPDGLLVTFENWQKGAMEVLSHRKLNNNSEEFEVVSSLGFQWNDAMTRIREKISTVLGVLQNLKPDKQESGIYTLVSNNIRLAESLIGEMDVAIAIEKTISSKEQDWIQQEVGAIVRDHTFKKAVDHRPAWNIH